MKSIHALILGNLRKMLVAALGLAAFLLLAYTYVSYRESESQAVNFVMSHVVSLAQAGVYSQNVAEIDKDLGRFVTAWKDTQNLDLRIDVFLDGKQVGHAGPMHPFENWASTAERSLDLPSGQRLLVKLQTDLTKTVVWGACLLLVFEGAIVAAFYVLMRSMRKSVESITAPLEGTVSWLREIASSLPESAKVTRGGATSEIVEIEDLGKSIQALIRQILVMEEHLTNVGLEQARLKFAEQVAHNVKGVIATLQLKVSSMTTISTKEKNDILGCADALRDISASLLTVKRPERRKVARLSAVHLFPLVKTAVLSKQSEAEGRCRVDFENEGEALACFAGISPGEIQSVISNLIDNSTDAVARGGRIAVALRKRGASVELTVTDNGKGVPTEVLPHLMREHFSYGKSNGSGIGLFHAKQVVEAVGGRIEIESQEGVGTKVTLTMPEATADPSLVVDLQIPPQTKLVCVDDDSLIHQVLDMKIKPIRAELEDVVHLQSVAEFERWMNENAHGGFGTRLYLFDYDLKSERTTGLGLIEEYGLALESVLVSGLASDAKIAIDAKRLGVRRLPKDFLDIVPFSVGRALNEPGQSLRVT